VFATILSHVGTSRVKSWLPAMSSYRSALRSLRYCSGVRNSSSLDSCVRSTQWMATSMCSVGGSESNCCPCESDMMRSVV
jgi:hypothetical protein